MRKVLGGAVLMLALGAFTGACQGELPTQVTYECPITNSGGDTISVGDTISLDCRRLNP